MKHNSYKKNKGFTLVEIVVTLLIAGVLMSYAIPSYRDFSIRQNLSNQTNDLIGDLMFARVTAVKNGKQVIVESIDGADWSEGWRIFEVEDDDFVYTDGDDTLLREVAGVPLDLKIVGPLAIGFDAFGAKSGLGVAAIEEAIAISHDSITDTKTIRVSLSGLVN